MASPLALLLLCLAVGGATAHHQGHFSDPSVSSRQVKVGGSVTVAVTYTDTTGASPAAVAVVVDRTNQAMIAGSDAFKTGVRYEASLAPGAGWHAIGFTATGATGDKETVWAGYVQVTGGDTSGSGAATPAPASSPRPKPTATGKSSPTQAVGKGGNGGSGESGNGGGDGGSGPTPSNGGSASSAPGVSSAPGALGSGSPVKGVTPVPGGAASPKPTSAGQTGQYPSATTTTGPGAGERDDGLTTNPSAGPTAAAAGNVVGRAVEETGLAMTVGVEHISLDPFTRDRHASLPTLLHELTPTIATVTTGGVAWAVFVLFGKRRRDGDEFEPDPLLAASASTGVDTNAAHGLRVVDESQMPRWRRPSLQQVRKADPLRAVAEAPTMSFATAGVRPLERYERRNMRYRLVRLLDCPDEVRASEIGILDRGDEVQLLERYGVYWRVLCPDGRTGWVHRMTLSEPVSESAFEVAEAVEPCGPTFEVAFVTTGNSVAATADVRGENVDGLLEAYMRARSDVPRTIGELEPIALEVEPARAAEPAPTVEPSVALARGCLERVGFVVQGPEPATEPAVEPAAEPELEEAATIAPIHQPSSGAAPAAKPARAGGQYSGRKPAGSRKASSASRPGTRSRRP